MEYTLLRLSDRPELKNEAAEWFHRQWGIPLSAYVDSMDECLAGGKSVPQWYMAVADGAIVGGLGVIENDFHERHDLAPNVCAVFTDEKYRCRGIAGGVLDLVCWDMKVRGIGTLYLVTDHVGFYERYGWSFLCHVKCDDGSVSRMYTHVGRML